VEVELKVVLATVLVIIDALIKMHITCAIRQESVAVRQTIVQAVSKVAAL